MSFQHSLPNALSYADDGSVITFRGNIDITADSTDAYKNLVANKDITIDLAGYSLTSTVGAALTITSNTTIQNGTVSMSSMGGVALIVSGEGAKLTLSGADTKVQATGTASSGISVASSAAFVMTGGSITAQSGNGVLLASGTTAAITGGTISAYWPVNITGQTSFISGSVDATTGAITSVPTFVATGTYTGQDPYDSLKLVDGWTLIDVDKTDASQGKTLAYDFSQVSVSLVPNSSTYIGEWQTSVLTVKMQTLDGTITLPQGTAYTLSSSLYFLRTATYTLTISPTNTDHYLNFATTTYTMNPATPVITIAVSSASDSETQGKLDATIKTAVEGVGTQGEAYPYGTCSLQYKKAGDSTWTDYTGTITTSWDNVHTTFYTATITGLDEDKYDFKATFTPVHRDNHSDNYASNTGTQTLQIAKGAAGVTISGAPASVTYGDAGFELTATVSDAGTGTGTYTWASSDSNILSVTPDTTDPSKAVVKVLKADSTGAKISVAYESSSTEGSAETASIPVKQKTLTVSGVSAADKTYDGTTTVAITGTATLSEVLILTGDDVSLDATNASASFADKNAGTSKTVSFSGYTLSGTDAENYTLTQPTTTAAITPKEITPVWDTSYAYTKVYDGTTDATNVALLKLPTDAACSGDFLYLVNSSSTPYQYDSAAVGQSKTISVSPTLLTLDTGATPPNVPATNYVLEGYTGTTTDGTYTYYTYTHAGTITKADASVTTAPAATNPTYTGSAQTLISTGTTSDGTLYYRLKTSDSTYTEWSTSLPSATNAGSYEVQYYVKGDANHNDSTFQSITASIAKATYSSTISGSLDVLTNTEVTYTYDFASQLKGIDGAKIESTENTSDDDYIMNSFEGADTTVTVKTNSVSGEGKTATIKVVFQSTNYNNFTGTLTLTTKNKLDAGMTLSGVPTSLTYADTHTLTATVTNAGTGTGTYTWTSSNPSILSVTPDATDPSKAVVRALKADTTGATISITYSSDTTEDTETTARIPVNKKALTITGVSAANKTYDATTDATITGTPALNGVLTGDTVSLDSTSAKASFADKNAGAGKTVTFTGYTLSGTDAANYTLTQPTTTATISPKAVTPVWDTSYAYTKTYDGTKAAGSVAQLDVPNGAACAGEVLMLAGDSSTSYQFNSENVSEANKISVSVQLLIEETSSGMPSYGTTDNYVLAGYEGTVTVGGTTYYTYTHAGTITKATPSLTTTPTAVSGLAYTGSTQTLVSAGTASGGSIAYRYKLSSASDYSEWSTAFPAATNAGTYDIQYKVAGDANHNDTAVLGTLSASIAQASTGSANLSDSVGYSDTSEQSFSIPSALSSYIVAGDTLTYGNLTVLEGQEYLEGTPSIDAQGNLTYTLSSAAKVGDTVKMSFAVSGLSNYDSLTANVTLTRSACTHPANMQEIRNAKAATATENGYTGDTYCTQCGELVSYGSVIPATGSGTVHKAKLASTGDATSSLAAAAVALAGVGLAVAGYATRRRKGENNTAKRKSIVLIMTAVIMAVVMVMPIKAFAAAQEIDIRYYDSAGSIQTVTWNAADSAEVRLSDSSYMSWNGSTKTLYLNNMKLAGVNGAYALESSFLSPINIELDGRNSISSTTGYGISASHTINITGPGSLDIKSHENGYAIKTLGLLSVSSGATIAADGEISSNSYMNISDSTVRTTSRLICFATLNISGNSDVSAYGLIVDNALVLYPDTGELLEVKTGTSETDATHVSGSPFSVASNCGRMSGVSYFHVKEHNHSYNGYETNDTEHWQKCSDCGALTTAESHTPTTINAKDATATKDGYTGDTVCSVCGYEIVKGKVIPATGSGTASSTSGTGNGTLAATGDATTPLAGVMLALAGVALVCASIITRHRTEQ